MRRTTGMESAKTAVLLHLNIIASKSLQLIKKKVELNVVIWVGCELEVFLGHDMLQISD